MGPGHREATSIEIHDYECDVLPQEEQMTSDLLKSKKMEEDFPSIIDQM